MHVYVFVRLGSLPLFKRRSGRMALIGAGMVLWLVFYLGLFFRGGGHGFIETGIEVAGMHWMGSLFIVATCLLAADLASGFGFLFPRAKVRIRTLALTCGLALVLVAHVQGLRPPSVEMYDATLNGLPAGLDGTTVAMISDLHAGEMMIGSRWLAARADQVQALRPDCVVLVGDLLERGGNPVELAQALRRLSAPLGVWAVRGNHDMMLRPGRRDVLGETLGLAGIRLVENEWARLTDGLVLAGVDDLTSSHRRPGEGEANIDRALGNRPQGATILLSHTPWMTGRAAAGVDLMLSAHTHNGQIWPFNYLVSTRYPLIRGSYDINGMTLIVCRGTGTWGPRMRLWTPGEISLVTLRAPVGGKI